LRFENRQPERRLVRRDGMGFLYLQKGERGAQKLEWDLAKGGQ
jgi:hypothetical protein